MTPTERLRMVQPVVAGETVAGVAERFRVDRKTVRTSRWMHHYDWHRPHQFGRRPPISRVPLGRENVVKLHT